MRALWWIVSGKPESLKPHPAWKIQGASLFFSLSFSIFLSIYLSLFFVQSSSASSCDCDTCADKALNTTFGDEQCNANIIIHLILCLWQPDKGMSKVFFLFCCFVFVLFFLPPAEHASSAAVNVPRWLTGIVKMRQKQFTTSIYLKQIHFVSVLSLFHRSISQRFR